MGWREIRHHGVPADRLLPIPPVILTHTKAYRPGLLGKMVGLVESPVEVWVPLAHHYPSSRRRFGQELRDLVFNNTRLV